MPPTRETKVVAVPFSRVLGYRRKIAFIRVRTQYKEAAHISYNPKRSATACGMAAS